MWLSLFSMEIDDEEAVKRVKDENDAFSVEELLAITKKITSDIIYSMFFEDPKEYLFCIIIVNLDDNKEIEEITFTATLDEIFHDKHIGKFIKEIQRRITNDIIIKFVTEMEKIDWRNV